MSMEQSDGGVIMPEARQARMPAQLQATDLVTAIASAASNPAMDVEKMERLMAMHERMTDQHAQQVYQSALSRMQPDLPVVKHRGDANKRYTYALWEDIHRAITPVMSRYGFSIFFKVDTADAVRVEATLAHEDGHRESTSITLPADASGNKNAVQAVASSIAYGKRYTAGALLNFATTGEDDDAQAAVEPVEPTITAEQASEIRDRVNGLEIPESKILELLGRARNREPYASLAEVPAGLFKAASNWLAAKEAA